MDTGIFTWFGYKYHFKEILQYIKDAGFQSVMIWWGDEEDEFTVPKKLQPELVRKIGLKLDNAHLAFGKVNYLWEDSLEGIEIFNTYCSWIDDCKDHNIPIVVMHASNGNNPPPYNELGLNRFKKLVEKAEKNNVSIALENVRKPEYIEYIFKNIISEKLKFCYDSGHENCFSPEIDFLSKYGDRLISLHLHDNNGINDQHLMPFSGNVNWKRIMTEIKRLEYKGSLSFELDAQFIDVTKMYTITEYLEEAKIKIQKVIDI